MPTARHRLAKCAVASALSVLFATAAQGAFYPARFDPGGNGFDIPGFNGNAVFDIPDSCVGAGTGWQATNANTSSGGCGSASMLSATVFLYSTDMDPPGPGEPPLGQFVLGTFDVLGVYTLDGAIAGVDTDPMGPVFGSGPYSDDSFWLQFVSGFCTFGCTAVPPMQPPPSEFAARSVKEGDPAYIFVNSLDNPSFPATVVFGAACEDPQNCVIAQVPEPGSLALILAALAAGWTSARRRF